MSRRDWVDHTGEVAALRSESLRLLDELRSWWPESSSVRSIGIAGGSLHLDFLRDCLAGEGPLVVIDPEDRDQVLLTADWLNVHTTAFVTEDEVQAALRDLADPKLPKPEEPTGLGAVVVDRAGVKWVRTFLLYGTGWVPSDENTGRTTWSDIDAVEVLSQGVTS